jgi:LEA14-like dessication related protein
MTKNCVHTDKPTKAVSAFRWMPMVLVLFVNACATVQQFQFEEPGFDLTSVRIDGLGLTGGSLTLFVDVDNPNSYDLRTAQIDLAIDFEDTRFGEAFLDGSTRFSSQSVTPIELPLSFSWGGVGAGARALLERGAIGYTLATKLTVDTPLGDHPIEMTTRGNVPVRRMIR